MRRFLRSVLLLGVFLGGYYLGHLPDSPDIFGWAVSVYQRVHRVAGEICARAEQDNVGVAEATVGYLLSGDEQPKR